MPEKTFDQWMSEVNEQLLRMMEVDYRDLPDCPYHDWFDDGWSPDGAAEEAIDRAMD